MSTQHPATLGAALAAAIDSSVYNQAEIASELNVNASQVSRWKTDKDRPTKRHVRALEDLLGCELSAFEPGDAVSELYVSSPISALNINAIPRHRNAVAKVVEATRQHVPLIYWPGRDVFTGNDRPVADIATERNLRALAKCKAFMYLQFEPVEGPTSSLIELGIALGKRIKTTIILKKGLPEPVMFDGFQAVAATLKFLPQARIYHVKSVKEACALVDVNGRTLLGLD